LLTIPHLLRYVTNDEDVETAPGGVQKLFLHNNPKRLNHFCKQTLFLDNSPESAITMGLPKLYNCPNISSSTTT